MKRVPGLAIHPINGIVDLAGPDPIPMDELARQFLLAHHDARQMVADPQARYYGTEVNDQSLTPLGQSLHGPTHFADWLRHSMAQA